MKRLLSIALALAATTTAAHAGRREIYSVKLNKLQIHNTRGTGDADKVHYQVAVFDTNTMPRSMDDYYQVWQVDESRFPEVTSGDSLPLGDTNLKLDIAQEFSPTVEMARDTEDVDIQYMVVDLDSDVQDPDKAKRDFLKASAVFLEAVNVVGDLSLTDIGNKIASFADGLEKLLKLIFGDSAPQSCDGLVLADRWQVRATDLLQNTANGPWVVTKSYNNVVSPKACGAAPNTDVVITITHLGAVDNVNDPTPFAVLPTADIPNAAWDGSWTDTVFASNARIFVDSSAHFVRGWHQGLKASHDLSVVENSPWNTNLVNLDSVGLIKAAEQVTPDYTMDIWPSLTIHRGPPIPFKTQRTTSRSPVASGLAATDIGTLDLPASAPAGALWGYPVPQLADTIHVSSDVTLRLYHLVSANNYVGAKRLRYTRTDASGTVVTDVMLQPTSPLLQ